MQAKTEQAEEVLKALRAEFTKAYKEVTLEVDRLCRDREETQRELNRYIFSSENVLIEVFSTIFLLFKFLAFQFIDFKKKTII